MREYKLKDLAAFGLILYRYTRMALSMFRNI